MTEIMVGFSNNMQRDPPSLEEVTKEMVDFCVSAGCSDARRLSQPLCSRRLAGLASLQGVARPIHPH